MSSVELYYRSGALYARLRDEKHEYFYEDGSLKTVEPRQNGRFHGEVVLFWPNGQMKRRCHFKNGMRVGVDQMWNDEGKLLDEQEYGNV